MDCRPTQPTHSDELVNLCFRAFTVVDIGYKLESYQLMEAAALYRGLVEGCVFSARYPHALGCATVWVIV